MNTTEQISFYSRLEDVMIRLETLHDLTRFGHYSSAVTVLTDIDEYQNDYAKDDHALIVEAYGYGIKSLEPILHHRDLSELDVLWEIARYFEIHLKSDIDAVDDALSEMSQKWHIGA